MKTSEIYKNYKELQYHKTRFRDYGSIIFSQNGEDGIIEKIFSLSPPTRKFFVEFGGWDGTYLSNTANLRINESWDGVLFEGDKERVEINKNLINIHHEYITSENVNDVFEKYNVPKEFGLLSIDIDGDDAYILESIDYNRFRPDLIVIEYNPGLPNHIPIRYKEQGINQTRANVEMGYFGANINAMYDIAKSKGYEFVTTCCWNIFFIRENLFDSLGIDRMEKDFIINTQSNSEGSEFWRNLIISNEMDWVVK